MSFETFYSTEKQRNHFTIKPQALGLRERKEKVQNHDISGWAVAQGHERAQDNGQTI